MMNHCVVLSTSMEIIDVVSIFSCFDSVDSRFDALSSLRRSFSIARARDMKTITVENIPSAGIIEDKNKEFFRFYLC